jgi:hypothetical protein
MMTKNFFSNYEDEFNDFLNDLSYEVINDDVYVGALVCNVNNKHMIGIVTEVHKDGYVYVEHFKQPQVDGCYSYLSYSTAGSVQVNVIRMNQEPPSVKERKRQLKLSALNEH